MPIEIQEKLKLINRDDLDEDDDELESILDEYNDKASIEDYVIGYININGIISKDLLKDMLLKNHEIELSFDEIEEMIKSYDIFSIEDKYYSLIDNKEEVLTLLSIKQNSGDYKILTDDIINFEKKYLDDIHLFVDCHWTDEDKNSYIKSFIFETTKFGCFNKHSFEFIDDIINLDK